MDVAVCPIMHNTFCNDTNFIPNCNNIYKRNGRRACRKSSREKFEQDVRVKARVAEILSCPQGYLLTFLAQTICFVPLLLCFCDRKSNSAMPITENIIAFAAERGGSFICLIRKKAPPERCQVTMRC